MARRNTQEPIEVPTQSGVADVNRRVTQDVVEAPEHTTLASLNRRVTQDVVEASEHTTLASLNRRVTQIVIEVPMQQPVGVFAPPGAPPAVDVWSPSFMYAGPIASGETLGIGLRIIQRRELGRRNEWIRKQWR